MPTNPLDRLRAVLDAATFGDKPLLHSAPTEDEDPHAAGELWWHPNTFGATFWKFNDADNDRAVRDLRAIAAWMNLRGPVLALVEAVDRYYYAQRTCNVKNGGFVVQDTDWEVYLHADLMLKQKFSALLAAIDKEVPDGD